jgi:hypothetical protein
MISMCSLFRPVAAMQCELLGPNKQGLIKAPTASTNIAYSAFKEDVQQSTVNARSFLSSSSRRLLLIQ